MDNDTTKTPMKMKQARIKKLAKQDWTWNILFSKKRIKAIVPSVQTLTKTVNNEFD